MTNVNADEGRSETEDVRVDNRQQTTDMKKVAMVFEKSELVLDIKHRAYILAKSFTQKSDKPDEDDNWLIDVANAEDLTREPAGRFINVAFMEAYTKCSSLAPEGQEGVDYVESDRYTEVSRYIMRLQVKDDTKIFQVRALQDLIHEFIVYSVLLQWCEMTSREHLEVLAGRLSALDGQIKVALRPIQGDGGDRPLFPFG